MRRTSCRKSQDRAYRIRRRGKTTAGSPSGGVCVKILAFESSAVSASVALTEDEKLIAQSFQNCGLTHSRTLLPMAEGLLANCGVTLDAVDALAGRARAGLVHRRAHRRGHGQKGFALGADKPCIGVSTLEAMAWGARGAGRPDLLRDGRARGTGIQRPVCHRGRRAAPPVRGPRSQAQRAGRRNRTDAVFSGWRRRRSVL